MNCRIKPLLLFYLLFGICYSLFAWDFGLTFSQNLGVSDRGFRYSLNMVPRVSGLIGEESDYYVSAGLEAAYLDGLAFIPELLRAEFTFRSGALAAKAGRVYQSDPLGLIASGLFDGATVSYDSSVGSFYAGAWYTGLLYKKRLNIEMTAADREQTNAPLDTDDFGGTYFAPKRLLTGFGWEDIIFGGEASASAAFLGQFDFSGGEALNSQYIAAKATLPVKAFSFALGGGLQLIQQSGELGTGFMAELELGFAPPISQNSKLSLLARYASGSSGGIRAFIPVTSSSQGNILEAKLSGLTMISLDYITPLHDTLLAGIGSSYFIRNDLETYSGYPLPEGDNKGKGIFLGNEFFARLLWGPFSDIQASLGGGVFLPSMGNAAPKTNNSWRVELNAILLLY